MTALTIIDDNDKYNNQSNLNSETPRTISKFNVYGSEYMVKDECARTSIDNLSQRLDELEEIVSIIQSEIKEINKKINNETFNFN